MLFRSPSTHAQKVVRKAARSAVDACKGLAKIGAFPNAVATAKCRKINGVIDRIDSYTRNVDGARSEKAAFPMPAMVRRSIETAARERARVDKFWLLRVEGNAAWRSGRQSLRAAIVPIATAIVSNEQPTVIRREEHVSVVGWIDCQRVPVLAAAVFQLSPGHSSPIRGPAIVIIGPSCRRWTLEHSIEVGSRED